MLKWVFGRRSAESEKAASREKLPTYDEAKRIASEGSVVERTKLAALRLLPPELLYFFATDPAPEVRQAVARNDGTPLQADILLVKDDRPEIRSEIGLKICRLLPTLSSEQNRRVTRMAIQVLEILAQDQLPDIRAMIAENVKKLDNVPKDLILRLARDVETVVAAPVLEFSPMLTERDLVDVIKVGIHSDVLSAIARREMLSKKVCRVIAKTEDELAVAELLQNRTARLDRETLAMIVDTGAYHPAWHEALVRRGELESSLAERVAGYVSKSLVEHLIATNTAITPEIADQMRAGVGRGNAGSRLGEAENGLEDDRVRASRMFQAGKLTAPVMTRAAARKEKRFIYSALSLLTGTPAETLERVLGKKNGNRLAVALAWKTRLGMDFATALQAKIIEVPEADRIRPSGLSSVDEDYPFDAAVMAGLLKENDIG